jgi:hypothetical protein
MYEGFLDLGLTPEPKVGIKHPRYLKFRVRPEGPVIFYLGPDSIEFHKPQLSNVEMLGNQPGAIDRSRDIKFMTDTYEGVRNALTAARLVVGR